MESKNEDAPLMLRHVGFFLFCSLIAFLFISAFAGWESWRNPYGGYEIGCDQYDNYLLSDGPGTKVETIDEKHIICSDGKTYWATRPPLKAYREALWTLTPPFQEIPWHISTSTP